MKSKWRDWRILVGIGENDIVEGMINIYENRPKLIKSIQNFYFIMLLLLNLVVLIVIVNQLISLIK